MTWCARSVAALPGAVVRIPAFSSFAFAAMILGALWLCLWRGPWRFWGLCVIAFGIYLASQGGHADIFVAEGGRLVAVRKPDGRLAAAPGHRQTFELTRWLEHDGDPRSADKAAGDGSFRCDAVGCTIRHRQIDIAISRSPASLADDCRRADLIILSYPKPAGCQPSVGAFDFWQLRDGETHAIEINSVGLLAVTTVEDARGMRPWTRRKFRPVKHIRLNARPSNQ